MKYFACVISLFFCISALYFDTVYIKSSRNHSLIIASSPFLQILRPKSNDTLLLFTLAFLYTSSFSIIILFFVCNVIIIIFISYYKFAAFLFCCCLSACFRYRSLIFIAVCIISDIVQQSRLFKYPATFFFFFLYFLEITVLLPLKVEVS